MKKGGESSSENDTERKLQELLWAGKGKMKRQSNIDTHRNDPKSQSENSKNISLECLSVHIGSQILDYKPYERMLKAVSNIINKTNYKFKFVDLGGGMGISYSDKIKKLNYKKYSTNRTHVYLLSYYHRVFMGTTDLGHLVGLGCSNNINGNTLDLLYSLHSCP